MFTKSIITTVSIAALLYSATAVSSNEESFKELRQWNIVMEARGFNCRDEVQGRYLAEGKSYTVNTELFEENSYLLVAAGNIHTKDIDMEVYDGSRKLVFEDDKTNKYPMAYINPSRDGYYKAKVTMYSGKGYSNLMVCWKRD